MQSILDEDEVNPVLQLSYLKMLYLNRVQQLGDDVSTSFHSTRFKNKILSYFPQLEAHTDGRDILLVCNKSVGCSLKRTCETDQYDETVIL